MKTFKSIALLIIFVFIQLLSLSSCGKLTTNKTLPEAVDLRNEMSTVKNQGSRNTCSCFAATALMEYLILKKTGKEIDLSEAYNYWLGKSKALDSDYTRKVYKDMDGLAGYLAVRAYMFGSMQESEWPYESKNWLTTGNPACEYIDGKPTTVCFTGLPPKNAKTLPYKIAPIFIKPEDISKFILKEKKPVVYNLLWINKAVDHKTGTMRMPTEEEIKTGAGHVVLLVGYNSKTKQFIFRNSWGPNWGDHGYGTIPEQYILKYGEVYLFEPIDQYPQEIREFLEKSKQGVSGTLEFFGDDS